MAGFLLASLKYRLAVLGGFVAPLAMIVLGAARLSPSGTALSGLTLLGRSGERRLERSGYDHFRR